MLTKIVRNAIGIGMTLATIVLGASMANAQPQPTDSSSDVQGGFGALLGSSHGLMIKVPVNERGEVNTDAAEMRVYTATDAVTQTDLPTAWAKSVDVTNSPEAAKFNVNSDSSTCRYCWGNWGWRNWGWQSYNYYNYYQPYYYYGNSYWNYSYPSYNYYYSGYNYYYYPYRGYWY